MTQNEAIVANLGTILTEELVYFDQNAYAYNDDGSLVRVDAEHFFNVSQTLLSFRLQFLRR